ncbi:MAG: helix-turn-helix transcriptional regulator [Pirellulales bacterium]|nr:helix-turn-helix transcriptional regulator [Pirellulales bacterium]
MSMTDYHLPETSVPYHVGPQPANGNGRRPLHQLALVRRREGLSRRAVARRLGTDVRSVRQQEEQTADMALSRLYDWEAALGVPASELLADTEDALSAPVLKRAQMVRLMKTAAAILERAQQPPIRRMAQMLVDQLIEVMPELEGISPWNAVGQRRTLDDLGQAAQRCLSLDALLDLMDQ